MTPASQSSKRIAQSFRCFFLKAAVFLAVAPTVLAHDIPSSASLQMYVKPESAELSVLLRVPMETMSEIQFPVRGPGYLDLETVENAVADAIRVYFGDGLRFFVDGDDLGTPSIRAARVSLPSNDSFGDYDSALAHLQSAPLTNAVDLFWNQAMLDVQFAYAMPSPDSRSARSPDGLAFRADLDRLAIQTSTVLHYLPEPGVERVYGYVGNPGLVELDPGWWGAFSRFVVLGFGHVLDGSDHLLFLLALVIPMRSIGPLVLVVTSFTIAHSITLISSALGMAPTSLWFPSLVETLIAASVFFLACENLLGVHQHLRWMVAYTFGLIHGFGFSFILADRMQFAGDHLVGALLAFNIGVELGQLLAITVAVPALWLLFRFVLKDPKRERLGVILLSALVAHSAWHWLVERGDELTQYAWRLPVLDVAFFASAARWAMLLVGSALVLLVMHEVIARFGRVIAAKPPRPRVD